jgi:transposase InsO family protein
MAKTQKNGCPARGASRRRSGVWPLELRRKAVQLYLEEGLPAKLISRELGVHNSLLHEWVRRFRQSGESGLEPRRPGRKAAPGPSRGPLGQRIANVKRRHPSFGVKRISQWLKRVLFLPASPETVRRTLHRQGLMPPTRKKAPRNPPKPRFFERSTPNQLWQSDLFTFRLGGKNAYLVGFVDDYSRYVVGLGLYRSQTAEHVLEVYRTAVAEYGVPKEMLTDQGRQYANWRGKTRFQQELAKDRVHHLLSRPHHPMTLGKVERFWKTIWEEFLVRAQFGSFEEAQTRVRYWVQWYNHKRPHQGLEGLCPADRFFQVQQDLRKVIEKGIQENVQALAMNRPPKEPFYMVGRLGGQSVVLSVEKGRFRMRVDGEEETREAHYTIGEELHDYDDQQDQAGTGRTQRPGEGPGGAGGVDGTETPVGDLPGAADHPDGSQPLAGAGDGGHARGAGAADTAAGGAEASVACEGGAAVGPQELAGASDEVLPAAGDAPAGQGLGEGAAGGRDEPVAAAPIITRTTDETQSQSAGAGGSGPPQGGVDRPGAERPDNGDGGGPATGRVAEDLLPVGTASPVRDDRGLAGQGGGPAADSPGCAEGEPPEAGGRSGGPATDPGAGGTDPGRRG